MLSLASSLFKTFFLVSSIVDCMGRVGHVHPVPQRAYHSANMCLGGLLGQLLPDLMVSQNNIRPPKAAYGQGRSQRGFTKSKVSHHPPTV